MHRANIETVSDVQIILSQHLLLCPPFIVVKYKAVQEILAWMSLPDARWLLSKWKTTGIYLEAEALS